MIVVLSGSAKRTYNCVLLAGN